MNAAEARQVLLVRAYEDPPVAPWSAADRDAVSREAAATVGAGASPEQLIAARAALAAPRILAREPQGVSALAAIGWPSWAMPLVCLLAFGSGLAIDALGHARHLNVFALPLLALMLWNLLVYALLFAAALRTRRPMARPAGLSRGLSWLLQKTRGRVLPSPALQRFAADWSALSARLQMQRITVLLHIAAALVALGVVAGMYFRGSVLEFHAGWESTFFDAVTMHRVVGWLLGPAAWLSGIALPGPQEFAALRLSAGGGELAARWINLYAVTLAGVVVLPRTVLALLAAWRARRLGRHLTPSLTAPYFRQLLPARSGPPQPVQLLPYSYQVPPEALAGVQQIIATALGGAVALQLLPAVRMGTEDDVDAAPPLPESPVAALAVLFAATATPERETHGAFVMRVADRLRGSPVRLLVTVDLSGFRRRFGGPGGAARVAQRRAAWESFGRDIGAAILFAADPAAEASA